MKSKELEGLKKRVLAYIEYRKKFYSVVDLQITFAEIEIQRLLEQALSPPTEDEIVEELNEYYKKMHVNQIYYVKETNTFENAHRNQTLIGYQVCIGVLNGCITQLENVPIKTQHKITQFFINEVNHNSK